MFSFSHLFFYFVFYFFLLFMSSQSFQSLLRIFLPPVIHFFSSISIIYPPHSHNFRKRYDKAEREFIEAKLQLFNKLEKKELLTEHLCRIIEANEQRKANKLSELMAKLEMVDVSAELPEPSAGEVLEDEMANR